MNKTHHNTIATALESSCAHCTEQCAEEQELQVMTNNQYKETKSDVQYARAVTDHTFFVWLRHPRVTYQSTTDIYGSVPYTHAHWFQCEIQRSVLQQPYETTVPSLETKSRNAPHRQIGESTHFLRPVRLHFCRSVELTSIYNTARTPYSVQ